MEHIRRLLQQISDAEDRLLLGGLSSQQQLVIVKEIEYYITCVASYDAEHARELRESFGHRVYPPPVAEATPSTAISRMPEDAIMREIARRKKFLKLEDERRIGALEQELVNRYERSRQRKIEREEQQMKEIQATPPQVRSVPEPDMTGCSQQ